MSERHGSQPHEEIHGDSGSHQMLDPMPDQPSGQSGGNSGVSAAVNTVIIMACINAAQKLIEEAVESGMEPDWFLSSLREIGITSSEAINYVDEFEQRTWICNEKGKAAEHPSPDNHHTNSSERTDSDQAFLDCGYNNDNKAKDFSAGFAIVKKDTLSKKKAVSTESKWIRIFDA
ncbi:hypothetical protein H0H87_001806 [Tephrocybe sp. NHM501043]|nr:hypothetical protein H0H87_001806 [Tephrocybe sp. NHM501043]